MSESKIQAKVIKKLEANGFYVIKISKSNKNGIPDLIVIPRASNVFFIEMKDTGEKAGPLQEFRISELERHGVKAFVLDNEDINEILNNI
jgi:Holliday junction resolvase